MSVFCFASRNTLRHLAYLGQPPFPAVRSCLAPQAPRWHPDPQIDWDSKMWLCHTPYRSQRCGHAGAVPVGQMVSWEHKCWFALLGISLSRQSYCWVSFPASVPTCSCFLPFAHQPLKSWFASQTGLHRFDNFHWFEQVELDLIRQNHELLKGCLLEKEVTTHSSIPAWRIPWTEGPDGLQSMGLQRVGHDWSDLAQHTHGLYYYSLQNSVYWTAKRCYLIQCEETENSKTVLLSIKCLHSNWIDIHICMCTHAHTHSHTIATQMLSE